MIPVDEILSTIPAVCKKWQKITNATWFWALFRNVTLVKPLSVPDFSTVIPHMRKLVILRLDVDLININRCIFANLRQLRQLTISVFGRSPMDVIELLLPVLSHLKYIEIKGASFNIEQQCFLAEKLNSVETFIITYAAPVGPDDFLYMISKMQNLKCINISIKDFKQKWANIVNKYCGKIRFGHNMIDQIPSNLLSYTRHMYHI